MFEFIIAFAIGWFLAKRAYIKAFNQKEHMDNLMEQIRKERSKTDNHYNLTVRTVDEINSLTV